jgi:hypothetical protein
MALADELGDQAEGEYLDLAVRLRFDSEHPGRLVLSQGEPMPPLRHALQLPPLLVRPRQVRPAVRRRHPDVGGPQRRRVRRLRLQHQRGRPRRLQHCSSAVISKTSPPRSRTRTRSCQRSDHARRRPRPATTPTPPQRPGSDAHPRRQPGHEWPARTTAAPEAFQSRSDALPAVTSPPSESRQRAPGFNGGSPHGRSAPPW